LIDTTFIQAAEKTISHIYQFGKKRGKEESLTTHADHFKYKTTLINLLLIIKGGAVVYLEQLGYI
jgi:hypothetical protein